MRSPMVPRRRARTRPPGTGLARAPARVPVRPRASWRLPAPSPPSDHRAERFNHHRGSGRSPALEPRATIPSASAAREAGNLNTSARAGVDGRIERSGRRSGLLPFPRHGVYSGSRRGPAGSAPRRYPGARAAAARLSGSSMRPRPRLLPQHVRARSSRLGARTDLRLVPSLFVGHLIRRRSPWQRALRRRRLLDFAFRPPTRSHRVLDRVP